ncbi:DUF1493 family protein [Erwinia tracheiphila]|uniref:Cytoplasmic protein n=1 Tax=Erwinia tracheiphila TaxID=65700 RepID=A0A0M2KEA6_9GAMM|nr:DUF1493 family protein [Erwinia tracheiphila]AXF78205.1 DUF1493 family protein [Erwinia tracheiphila]EOS95532.1 hypothetical protein ETR_07786 [Erwinia tracheiphila PSU-1]KKF37264.1 cytoplasmic protein [Erwinia tracheiphila]UIA83075.1 DUF1493 family protein [Erwinia tracheiphila]UIA88658.1 DUF1493 family protein [Erwinia tracheiphila]
MVTDDEILSFFRDKLPETATLTFKRIPFQIDDILQESIESDDMAYAINDYAEKFFVDMSSMNFESYYPWKVAWFFRKWYTSKPLNQEKKPLTVRMLAESAKAGRWLYD